MKILIYEPMPLSAVSYYRSIGTIPYLEKLNKNIRVEVAKTVSWSDLAGVDILYMERPQEDRDLDAMEIAKQFGCTVWVDYDDYLHEIPDYNPSSDFYRKTLALENIEKAMKSADIMTVSTEKLKEVYSKYNDNIHVIHNAHNDYQYPFKRIKETIEVVNWRGSATHRDDLLSIQQNLFTVAHHHSKWSFCFVGNDVWYMTGGIRNSTNIKECDIVTYNKFIKDLKAAIQIVPLLDNEFNRAKSNIGYIEGTYAGSVTIGPDLPEFQKPGCMNYNASKPDHFGYLLEKCMKSKQFRRECYEKSYEYVNSNLLLSKVNQKRLEIVEGMR